MAVDNILSNMFFISEANVFAEHNHKGFGKTYYFLTLLLRELKKQSVSMFNPIIIICFIICLI